MANDVRTPGLRPGQVPGQEPPSLQQKEQAKAQQKPLGKVSAEDAARLAQQAGFHRGQKKPFRGFDIGDSAHAPIPIPDEDTDTEAWSPERLEAAQESLAMASAHLGEASKAGAPEPLSETITASSFLPTGEGAQKLQALADRPAPAPMAFDEVTTSVKSLFDIELSDDVPIGQKMLVTGLVVAGEAASVEVHEGKVSEPKLAGALQKVTERSNQAVGEAQKMSKGVNRELNLQRTFVFKR